MSRDLCTDDLRKGMDALENKFDECDKMCEDIMSENKPDFDKITSIVSQSVSENFKIIFSLFESVSLIGDSNTIKSLCKQSLSEVKDTYENTCILIAAKEGNLNLVQSLIECGCKQYAVNNDKDNALHLASKYGKTDVVRYLISVGFDKDYKNPLYGYNALLYASLGHLETVKYLVSIGCDINSKNNDGQNAIHVASYFSSLETVKYLVSIGCDAKLCDKKGHNAIHIAASVDNPGLTIYKYRQCFNIDEDIKNAAERLAIEHIDTIKYLVSIGCDPNLSDENGVKAIHIASAKGNIELIKYLASIGCDVNSLYIQGGNAIHAAVSTTDDNKTIFSMLPFNECKEKNVQSGESTLHFTAFSNQNDVIKYQNDRGLDINACNNNNKHLLVAPHDDKNLISGDNSATATPTAMPQCHHRLRHVMHLSHLSIIILFFSFCILFFSFLLFSLSPSFSLPFSFQLSIKRLESILERCRNVQKS